jgi:hydrogenase small subunit
MLLKQDKKPSIIWFQGVTCNGNTHSFLNLDNLEKFLDKFEILSHPSLPSIYNLDTIASCVLECNIFIFEGTYDPLMKRNDILISKIVQHYAKNATDIIA